MIQYAGVKLGRRHDNRGDTYHEKYPLRRCLRHVKYGVWRLIDIDGGDTLDDVLPIHVAVDDNQGQTLNAYIP